MNKEDKIVEVVGKHLARGKVDYKEIYDYVEEEYLELFLECVKLYGYQEFLDLWIYRNKQNNQYIYVRPDSDAIEFDNFLDNVKKPMFEQIDGTFIYKFMMLGEDEIEEDLPELYYVEFVNNG